MRLPKISQLTEEQKRVYLYAPTDKHVLVHGPPGTGKTLIACLRAIELQKKMVPVVLGMFNRVLSKYSSNVSDGDDMPSKTVLMWFRDWWKNSGLPPHSGVVKPIAIQAPYEDREQLKAAGARWNPAEWRPWGNGRGVWMVDAEKYFCSPELFSNWGLWHAPPTVEGVPNRIDWEEVAKHILNNDTTISDEMLDLGTLLVDEGQDFPPGFYRTLRQISALSSAPGRKIKNPLRCFVLADENQQITEENSTLQQIADSLKISDENRYLLLDNFRNSKEIAELAREFFADVGVLPRLPDRSSEKPTYTMAASHADVVQRIKIWLTNNPKKEVGVLVFNEGARESIVTALQHSLGGMRGRDITVQTYSWNTRQENKVDNLLFDAPDVVTVLNTQSCKGLEFDAVFIVDLHQAQIGIYGPDRFKMQMFVAVSRGREWVSLIDTGGRGGSGAYFECLPGPEFLERENGGHAAESVKSHPKSKPPEVSAPPTAKGGSAKALASGHADDWEAKLRILSKQAGFAVKDLRSKQGAVWVNGGKEMAHLMEPLGFQYAEKRSGWWRK